MDIEQETLMVLLVQVVDTMEVQQVMMLMAVKQEQVVHHLYQDMKDVMRFLKNQQKII